MEAEKSHMPKPMYMMCRWGNLPLILVPGRQRWDPQSKLDSKTSVYSIRELWVQLRELSQKKLRQKEIRWKKIKDLDVNFWPAHTSLCICTWTHTHIKNKDNRSMKHDSLVKDADCFSREPRLDAQHLYNSPQSSLTPVQRSWCLFWSLHVPYTHTWYMVKRVDCQHSYTKKN